MLGGGVGPGLAGRWNLCSNTSTLRSLLNPPLFSTTRLLNSTLPLSTQLNSPMEACMEACIDVVENSKKGLQNATIRTTQTDAATATHPTLYGNKLKIQRKRRYCLVSHLA